MPESSIPRSKVLDGYISALKIESYATALAWIELALISDPNDEFWLFQYGETLWNLGRSAQAERVLMNAYPTASKYRVRIQIALGRLYAAQWRLPEAEHWLRTATEELPGDTAPWIHLGVFFARQEKFAQAIEKYEKALSAHGDVDEVYLNIGLCNRSLGHLENARRSFMKAIELDPEYTVAKMALEDVESAIRITRQQGEE
jgi:tetratricopeptide (TPR) repeat protein